MSHGAVRLLCAGAVILLLCAPAQAGFVVDGDLRDWEIVNNSAHTDWDVPAVSGIGVYTTSYGFKFKYAREDSSDTAGDSGYIGPNSGGQNYDTEFLAAGVFGSELRISIVTGQRRDNGFERFAPGDLRITMTPGGGTEVIYGLEIGGGRGGTTGTSVNLGDPGSTYGLNSSGFTTSHTASATGPIGTAHVAGSIWRTTDTDWILDPISGGTGDKFWPEPGKDPVQLQFTGGTYAGMASAYKYKFGSSLGQKAVIEISIPMSVFGGLAFWSVQWGPSCGNDILHVPEPASFGILMTGALGFLGVAGLRRRKS